ncbi:cell cycle control protein [Histomonas meleagridis]|uniref:cell cycle control protein n=1 Tax=Histomonas meleagridis TaxID=135588 RepID=UPI003559FBDA|nr:cell cycle control protein [Histomonas meleagridis]KAH0796344.1 cell cycle control protein [Histomonas meleagridis]
MIREGNEVRPPSLFLTQQLPSKLFEITVRLFIVILVVFSLLFAIIGVVFLFTNNNEIEFKEEYGSKCGKNSTCEIVIEVTQDIEYPIALLYEIEGFYQNHLKSFRSRNDKQLLGTYVRYDEMVSCKPYRSIDDDPSPNKWLLPCGLQAMTFFNDTFEIKGLLSLDGPGYPEVGISPHNLNNLYQTGQKWLEQLENYYGNQVRYRFSMWMDTAAFPIFRRIWGITTEKGTLTKQNLTIIIQNNFDVSSFGGKKSIVLTSKRSYTTGASNFGILYVSFSGVMLISSIVAAFVNRFATQGE